MPAHEVFQILIDIWSGGCNPQLYYALPTLFALEIVGLLICAVGVYRRCHYAVIAEEAAEAAFKDRISVALAAERRLIEERKKSVAEGSDEIAAEEEREEKELEDVIRDEDKKLQRRHTRAEKDCNYGPKFSLAYNNDASDSSIDKK